MSNKLQICFERPTFNMYMFILICVIGYLIYFKINSEKMTNVDLYSSMDKDSLYTSIINMKDELFNSKLNEQKCEISLQALQQTTSSLQNSNTNIQSRLLEKIYNPLISPESIYPNGRINNKGFDGYNQFQMLGYLSGGVDAQFPVFGRYKYPGKTDKLEYYTIGDSRNRVKIVIKTKNYNELYDGDKIEVPQISNTELTFNRYDIENVRYSPNI